MTNLLHTAQTLPTPASSPALAVSAATDASFPEDNILSLTSSPAGRRASPDRPTQFEVDTAILDEPLSPTALEAMSNRQVRVLVNQAYRLLDTDFPPSGAVDLYERLVDELEHRTRSAAEHGPVQEFKETFRDSPLYCRFELFIDGTLAGYVKYTMNAGQVILLDSVEKPGFRDQGIDATLMRHVVLNTHKRRLNLVPQCPMAVSFLTDNPQYQTLTGEPAR